jgi:hypothetical protein
LVTVAEALLHLRNLALLCALTAICIAALVGPPLAAIYLLIEIEAPIGHPMISALIGLTVFGGWWLLLIYCANRFIRRR